MKKKSFTVDLSESDENPIKIDATVDNKDLEIIVKDTSNHIVSFPENPTAVRSFDFTPYYDQGYDSIASVCEKTIRYLVAESIKTQQQSLAITTITNYCYVGLTYFFPFLTELKAVLERDMTLEDITPDIMVRYVHHLKGLDIKSTSQRIRYNAIKAVFTAAIAQGRLTHADKKNALS